VGPDGKLYSMQLTPLERFTPLTATNLALSPAGLLPLQTQLQYALPVSLGALGPQGQLPVTPVSTPMQN